MFAVIYRGYLKKNCEELYQNSWKKIASYFVKECGALGSCLHKAEDGMWLAYSKWPDKQTRDLAWVLGQNIARSPLPSEIQEAIKNLKECLDHNEQLPEICMEIVEEIAS